MDDSATPALRVFVVAGYPSARAGLRAMLDGRDDIVVVGEASSLTDLGEFGPGHAEVLVVEFDGDQPDGLATLELPAVLIGHDPSAFNGRDGISQPGARLLREAGPAEIAAAVRAAARGLVVLDPAVAARFSQTAEPLAAPASAALTLTARERSVLGLVALGLPNKGIARELGISEHTVKFHVGAILGKLGAASRAEAVALAARQGLLSL